MEIKKVTVQTSEAPDRNFIFPSLLKIMGDSPVPKADEKKCIGKPVKVLPRAVKKGPNQRFQQKRS